MTLGNRGDDCIARALVDMSMAKPMAAGLKPENNCMSASWQMAEWERMRVMA